MRTALNYSNMLFYMTSISYIRFCITLIKGCVRKLNKRKVCDRLQVDRQENTLIETHTIRNRDRDQQIRQKEKEKHE